MVTARLLNITFALLLGGLSFLFIFKSDVYACRLTAFTRIDTIAGSCEVSNVCAPARTYDLANPNATVYQGRTVFIYEDIPPCEQTVFYNGLAACEAADLSQVTQSLSCRGTCNRITAGCGNNCFDGYSRTLADGSTITFRFCSGDGSYCTGASSATPPFSFTPGTSAPEPTDAEFCETWRYGYDCNLGGSCSLHTGGGTGVYSSLAACRDACRIPTVTLTVNNTSSSITVDKGEGYFLNWSTTNNPTNCTATGSWSWSLDSPPNNLSGGSQTDSKNQAGIHTYTLTCGNGAGSDTRSVAVTVRQTPSDYTTCSSCTSHPNAGWTGSSCAAGTVSGPTGGSLCPAWYWFDCLTNQCDGGSSICNLSSSSCGPGTTLDSKNCTCVSTTCTTALTCAIQPAVCTSATSGRATVAFTGCSAGYDRIEWFVDGLSKGSNPASSTGGSADLTVPSSNTTYNVSATAWSSRTDPNIDWSQRQTPAVPCGSATLTTNCSTDTTPPPPSTLECLLCESNTWNAEGTWVNLGERNCNDYICPTYPHRCDQPPLQQAVVSANRNLSGSANYRRGEMCFKNDGSGGTPVASPPPGTITGTFYIRAPGSSVDSLAPNTASNNWDHLRYWITNSSGVLVCPVNDGSMCITAVNSLGAYASACDSPMASTTVEADLNRVGFMLYSWPIYFRPIGYYIHQETFCSANCGTRCPAGYAGTCTTNPDGSKTPWTGNDVCSNGDCCLANPGCEDDPGRAYNCRSAPKSTLRPFPNPNGWVNGFANSSNNISTCTPRDGDIRGYNPIVDVVFERLPILSGNVCLETPPVNGLKDGTDSNFQGALVNIQGPTSLTRVTSNADINYQIPLTAGSYSITVTGGNSTITSINGPNNYFSSPALLTISQDTIANFCFNPVGAWLQTTGGSVHSNTRIRMPGGP